MKERRRGREDEEEGVGGESLLPPPLPLPPPLSHPPRHLATISVASQWTLFAKPVCSPPCSLFFATVAPFTHCTMQLLICYRQRTIMIWL